MIKDLEKRRDEEMKKVKHCCLTCDRMTTKGECVKHELEPPEDFIEKADACQDWRFWKVPF